LSDLPDDVTVTVHLCCGYPNHLDQEDYEKADKEHYITLAPLLDDIPEIKQVRDFRQSFSRQMGNVSWLTGLH